MKEACIFEAHTPLIVVIILDSFSFYFQFTLISDVNRQSLVPVLTAHVLFSKESFESSILFYFVLSFI